MRLIGTLLWLPMAWSLWERAAVLQPLTSIDLGRERGLHSFSRSGHLVVHARRLQDDASISSPLAKSKNYATYGPIEFYSTRDGRKLYERFASKDEFFSLEVSPETVTVIRRDEKTWVADLETGDLLGRLPDDDVRPHFHFRAGENRVLITDDSGIRCYDYVAGQDVWRFPRGPRHFIQDMTPTHAISMGESVDGGKSEMTAVRLTDGKPEDAIGPAGTYGIEDHSPDGRFLVVSTRRSDDAIDYALFDTVLQKSTPLMKSVSGYSRRNLAFTSDSSELHAFVLTDGRVEMGRMRMSDAEILDDAAFRLLSSGARFSSRVDVSKDHQWAIASRAMIDDARWRSIQDFMGLCWKFFGSKYTRSRVPVETALYELPGGRRLGVVAREWPSAGQIAPASSPAHTQWLFPDSHGFVLQRANEHVAYLYSRNASRDWKSLVAAVVVPPLCVLGLGSMFVWRRRRAAVRIGELNRQVGVVA